MDNNEILTFAHRMKEVRTKMNLKQNELAEKIGITPASISAYEKYDGDKVGKKPSLETAIAISKVLNVSLDWMCGLSEESSNMISPFETIYNLCKISDIECSIDPSFIDNKQSHQMIKFITNNSLICDFIVEYNKISDFLNSTDYPKYLKQGLKKTFMEKYKDYSLDEKGYIVNHKKEDV